MVDIKAELKQGFEEFKAKQEESMDSIRSMIKEQEKDQKGVRSELKQAMEKAEHNAGEVQKVADRLVEAEQKLVDGIRQGSEAPRSLGALVVESDEFKHFASGKTQKMRISLKQSLDVKANTITGQSGSPASNNDTLSPADRMPGVIPGAFRRLRVRDLIPSGNTSQNSIEVTRELTFTNNAAETAEGATKPESALTFELYNAPVVTIAHWLKVSKQVRDDAPAVMSYINTRLAYGVDLREDKQLIAGNGTGQNLKGMTHSDNYTAFTPTSGDNALDSLNRAKYIIDNADYQATGIIMNPLDWGEIERTKVGSSDERYVIGDPRSAMGPFLWGLPVIVTPSMTENKLLVGAFDISFMYWLREETTVEMFEQDDTNAQQNLITLRGEKRAALAGQRPASVRYGDLTA